MADARFEDAEDRPLRLRACDPEDLKVISAFIQDAVFKRGGMSWRRPRREFSVLLRRFRWETKVEGRTARRGAERVQSVLTVSDILDISAVDLADTSAPEVFSCLELRFRPEDDISGSMSLILSGDREVVMQVECVEVSLTDVTSPYPAASKNPPDHG